MATKEISEVLKTLAHKYPDVFADGMVYVATTVQTTFSGENAGISPEDTHRFYNYALAGYIMEHVL